MYLFSGFFRSSLFFSDAHLFFLNFRKRRVPARDGRASDGGRGRRDAGTSRSAGAYRGLGFLVQLPCERESSHGSAGQRRQPGAVSRRGLRLARRRKRFRNAARFRCRDAHGAARSGRQDVQPGASSQHHVLLFRGVRQGPGERHVHHRQPSARQRRARSASFRHLGLAPSHRRKRRGIGLHKRARRDRYGRRATPAPGAGASDRRAGDDGDHSLGRRELFGHTGGDFFRRRRLRRGGPRQPSLAVLRRLCVANDRLGGCVERICRSSDRHSS